MLGSFSGERELEMQRRTARRIWWSPGPGRRGCSEPRSVGSGGPAQPVTDFSPNFTWYSYSSSWNVAKNVAACMGPENKNM